MYCSQWSKPVTFDTSARKISFPHTGEVTDSQLQNQYVLVLGLSMVSVKPWSLQTPFLIGAYHEVFTCLAKKDKAFNMLRKLVLSTIFLYPL